MGLPKLFSRFSKRGGEKDTRNERNNNSANEVIGTKGKVVQCRIILLDQTDVTVHIKNGSKGELLLEQVFTVLDLQEKSHFGLRYLDEVDQTHWLDPFKQLNSQLKTPPFTLYFGVKFYPVDPCKMKEEITRYQLFLQVKADILESRIQVDFNLATDLACYSIQSELGDFDPSRHTFGYVSELRFVPNQTEEFEVEVANKHRRLKGITPAMAEYRFLDKAKWLEMYGVDLHPVKGDNNQDYLIGVTPTGLIVYRDFQKVGNYFWTRITKMTYKAKQYVLKVRDRNQYETTYAFECKTKAACKHIWKCCVDHHAFYRFQSETESYSNTGKFQFFSLGSKNRSSTRSTQDSDSEKVLDRNEPQVVRKPSKRHQRRDSTESLPTVCMDYDSESQGRAGVQLMGLRNEPQGRDRGYMSAPESPRSARAPWEQKKQKKGGLFTSGGESPTSAYSERLMFPRRQYESETEAGGKFRYTDPLMALDDFREKCRVPAEYTDASESEAEHRHRRRRGRRSADNLHEQEWQIIQQRIRDPLSGPFPLRPNNGSMSSVASGESAARRRRRRSRSPGNKKPPDELAQHFKYVDPVNDPEAEQQMKDDIPYTVVATAGVQPMLKAKAHRRHRSKSPKTRNLEVVEKGGQQMSTVQQMSTLQQMSTVQQASSGSHPLPDGMLPPLEAGLRPLPDGMLPAIQPLYKMGSPARNTHVQSAEPVMLQAPPMVQRNASSTAPIVKTSHVTRVQHMNPHGTPSYNYPPPYLSSNVLSKQPSSSSSIGNHMREDSGVFLPSNSSSAQGSPGSGQHYIQGDVGLYTQRNSNPQEHTYEQVNHYYRPPVPPLPVSYQGHAHYSYQNGYPPSQYHRPSHGSYHYPVSSAKQTQI